MDPPFGHNHHHHRNEDEQPREGSYYPPPSHFTSPPPPPSSYHQPPPSQPPYYPSNEYARPQPPPPQPFYQSDEFAPPPPPPSVTHFHHSTIYPPNHEQGFINSDQTPPAETRVTHVAHHVNQQPYEPATDQIHNSFKPHIPGFSHQNTTQGSSDYLASKPTVKVFTKAEPNFSLTIRGGNAVLAPSDPSDEYQHWYKDEKYSTRVKDEEGFPCFALVNKTTRQALKKSEGDTRPVQLVPYNSDKLDLSILWSQSKDLGDNYRTIRLVNDIRLNVDAFHGDKNSGGVRDGTTIVLWQWNKGDNQLWKIVPY